MNAIEVRNVWKKFRRGEKLTSLRDFIPHLFSTGAKRILGKGELAQNEFWAVRDVNIEVKPHEAVAIIGPNGAGKSTMLKLLSRILVPDKGYIKVRGRLSALIEVTAGFHPELTGRENIYLNAAINGMKKQEVDKKIDSIIAFSEIEEFIDTPVKRYSSGMFSRLGFSVAAHMDPEILLIDEVLSVGDFAFQEKCLRKMKEFVESGVTVIFISHNMPSVIDLCSRAYLMMKGQVVKEGPTEQVVVDYYKLYRKVIEEKTLSELELVEDTLTDDNGNVRHSFEAGSRAVVRFKFKAKKDLNGIIPTFFVKNAKGLTVYSSDSVNTSSKKYSVRQGEILELAVKFTVNLPSGNYYIGLHIQDYPFKGYYFYEDNITGFSVVSKRCSGLAYLDAEWG